MLTGNNTNNLLPVFVDDNHLHYQATPSNQLQLFVPAGCSVDPVNYFGNEHTTPMFRPNKRDREFEVSNRKHKLQISLNYNVQDQADRSASIRNPDAVSTGLRLSYDDEERNSSVTSASGNTTAAPSFILSLGDNFRSELDRQKQELNQFIKIQEENLYKGLNDLKQRHIASFLSAIEKGVNKKLQEKDLEIENINRKNKQLIDRIKQIATEAQNWHYRAKYTESVVNVLKKNIQEAISKGGSQWKEGFGDSEVDSFMGPSRPIGPATASLLHTNCKVCKSKEVSVLLMPCRHLCLCKECDLLTNVCPVCQLVKSSSVQVYLC